MKFDVMAIVTEVASKIVGQVDADKADFMDTDFTDCGTQNDLVDRELNWLLDRKVPEVTYNQLVGVLLDHPEMQFCFNVCDMMVKDQMEQYIQAEREQAMQARDYQRSVL